MLGADDRVSIPPDAIAKAPVLRPGTELLAVLGSDQQIELLLFEKHTKSLRELFKAQESDQAHERAMVAAQVRYARVRIDSDRRVHMPILARLCLGLTPGTTAYVWLTISEARVVLSVASPDDFGGADEELSHLDTP